MLRSRLRRRQLTFEMPLVAASVECLRVQVAVLLQFVAPPPQGHPPQRHPPQGRLFRLKGHATNRRLKGIRLKGIRLKGIRIQSLCHASIGRRRKGKTADVNLTPATAACGA